MEQLRKTVREFQELIKSQGWVQLVKYADGQVKSREVLSQQPPTGMDDLVIKTFGDGEIAGIKLFVQIPAVAMHDMEEQLEDLRGELNDG